MPTGLVLPSAIQWQNGPNRFSELRRRGAPKFNAAIAAGSPTGFWRMSGQRFNRPCATTLSTPSVSPDSMSLPKLNPVEPPRHGPVCPLVWEGWHREVSPYPDQDQFCDIDGMS